MHCGWYENLDSDNPSKGGGSHLFLQQRKRGQLVGTLTGQFFQL